MTLFRAISRLLHDLAQVRAYRQRRAARLPFAVRLPFVRNAVRHRALARWPGGYVLSESGHFVYVPGQVDLMAGYRLLKPAPSNSLVRALCKPGDTAIDVGANIGDWTLALAEAVGTQGKVYAFEPLPVMAQALEKTVAVNRLRQVQVVPIALASEEGETLFSAERGNTGGSRLGVMAGDFSQITVAARTLDGFLRGERDVARLDFIKIDVEGFESAVLEGAREVLARFRPALLLETGHEAGDRRESISKLLRPLGYRVVGAVTPHGIVEADWDAYLARSGPLEGALVDLLFLG